VRGGDYLTAKGRLCVVPASVLQPLKRERDPLTIMLRGALRCESRHGNFQSGGNLGDRLSVVLTAANKVHEGLAHRIRVHGSNFDPASDPDLEQPPGIERPYSLPNYGARNPELLTQLTLGGQRGARSQALRDDRLENLLRHAVRETRAPRQNP